MLVARVTCASVQPDGARCPLKSSRTFVHSFTASLKAVNVDVGSAPPFLDARVLRKRITEPFHFELSEPVTVAARRAIQFADN